MGSSLSSLFWKSLCPSVEKPRVRGGDVLFNKIQVRRFGSPGKPVVLLSHGNATNVDRCESDFRFLAPHADVWIYDYSYITQTDIGPERSVKALLQSGRDALTVLHKFGNIDEKTPITHVGMSLGGLVASRIARPGDKMLLLCPLIDLNRVLENYLGSASMSLRQSVPFVQWEDFSQPNQVRVWLAERDNILDHSVSYVPGVTPTIVPNTDHNSLLDAPQVIRELVQSL